MFIIPRAGGANGTRAFGTSSIGRRVDNDSIEEKSEIARKYSPVRKKLENIYKDIDADIKYIKRRGKEIMDLYPQKTNTEIEIMNTVSSLQGTKLQTVKAMMACIKDEITLENSRLETFHKISGGKMLGKTGGESIQSAAVIARGTAGGLRPGEIGSVLPVYNENDSYIDRHKGNSEYEDTSYFSVDDNVESNIPTEIKVGGGETSPSNGVETVEVVEEEIVEPDNTYKPVYDAKIPHIVDSKFSSILNDNIVPETAKYLTGDARRESFDELNDKMSYSTAATCLNNKMNIEGATQKMHYDYARKVGWLRTYDADNNMVDAESLKPLAILGDVEVTESGGVAYATDRFNNNYTVIADSLENMPEVLVQELKESIRNT